MNKLMVERAGAQFFDLASSLGRMHVKTLTGLADATAKTPLGPVFAANASVARMVNDGVESIAHRLVGEGRAAPDAPFAPVHKPAAPVAKAKPAAKPAVETKASEPAEALAKTPKTATKADKPAKAKKPAEKEAFSVDAAADTAMSLAIEPEADEVLVDEEAAIDIITAADIEATTDDLTVISGIGATTAKKLNGAGVRSFASIAAMSEDTFADLLASLDIKSIRFSPAKWIEEAKMFAGKSN